MAWVYQRTRTVYSRGSYRYRGGRNVALPAETRRKKALGRPQKVRHGPLDIVSEPASQVVVVIILVPPGDHIAEADLAIAARRNRVRTIASAGKPVRPGMVGPLRGAAAKREVQAPPLRRSLTGSEHQPSSGSVIEPEAPGPRSTGRLAQTDRSARISEALLSNESAGSALPYETMIFPSIPW